MRQTWTDGAAGWVANEAIYDAVFGPLTAALLDAGELSAGQRVLDVGCGTGTLLTAAVAAGADAVGVDISPGMAAAARERVPAATVVVADAQTTDLLAAAPGAAFDRVLSRFGVMFFADPVAAFGNLRAAGVPGARLVFVCWRGLEENPMFTLGNRALAARLDPLPEAPPPGAPGPMAFADPDRVTSILGTAGWTSIGVDPLDVVFDYGIDGSDGVEERLATILGTATGRMVRERLEPALGPAGWAEVLDEVRADLRRHLVDGTVAFPGATWLVTARNGG